MSQNVTPQDKHNALAEPCDPPALSVSQGAALERLLQGDAVTAAAQAAGVARETVHRWLRQDFAFQAALNRIRAELREATERRLAVIAHSAANSLNDKVKEGNLAASLAVLKGLGFLSGLAPIIGPQDASALEEETRLAEAERRHQQSIRAMFAER